ncbi:uncharacterized protein BJ212DRAFT_576088 [Suillus subaureus]|uniref:DUF6533 domain-containing protein n=1 Tax=Suillus subaureus TaxID=48587 RepID=A0A9P7E512_9AGAM|nr:uncharacterized protein BJ212DRAFT_576088 [Suillus subaureus]KAG1810923.1 hypothetical protein BJ212DRAFT_576088 [Suillus subaureus]
MQTDYSADDIAAATSLQFFTFIYVSITTFWTYDYVCSLHEEWRFLLDSHWTKVKGLYIVTRYLPFLLLATNMYLSFIPNETPSKCRVLDNICSGFGILSAVCSEGFFVLRTCALWNNNRILLAAVLVSVLTCVGVSIGITFTTTAPATYAISAIPGITGCYQSSTSLRIFIPFLLLSAFELGLMTLTLIRAIQHWRTTPSRLYVVLVKHNIFYYTCGFLFSVANIFTSLLLHYSYHAILHDFQFMILAILATRMHRHLWQMKRQTHGSDALMQVPMSDMSPAECTA